MGTKMAPSYANIFMGRLEQDLLSTSPRQPHIWWRFIDDIFMLWTHGETQLQTFIKHLNNHHHSIKFTAEWSSDSIAFLDTRVFLEGGRIRTDLIVLKYRIHVALLRIPCRPLIHATSRHIFWSTTSRRTLKVVDW